jgi:hypothetical protein
MKSTPISFAVLLPPLAAALLFIPSASAAPLDDKEAAFKAAIKAATMQLAAKNPSRPAIYGEGSYVTLIAQIKDCLNRHDENNAKNLVTSLLGAFPDDAAVQTAGQELLQALEEARKAREEAAVQRIGDALKKLPDAINQAQQPNDLDNILRTLADIEETHDFQAQETQKLWQQAQAAYRFAAEWQDYLSNRQAGQIEAAANNLRSLANNTYGAAIVPRSKILALAVSLRPTAGRNIVPGGIASAAILEEVKTVEDLPGAYAKLKALYIADPISVDAVDQQTLEQCLRLYYEAETGTLASVSFATNYNVNYDRASPAASRVQTLTLLAVLPHYLRPSKENLPQPGESLRDYLDRIATAAGKAGDWKMLNTILDTRTTMGSNAFHPLPSLTNNSVRSLVTAQNQETAGQYALAVEAYQTALRNLNEFVPAKLVGDRLADIEKNHPEAYKAGMELLRTPMVPAYPRGYPPGTYPGTNMPASLLPATPAPAKPSTPPAPSSP